MKDKNYLYEMYNATSTDDGKGDLETYENWLERQLLSRIERLEQLDLHSVSVSLPFLTNWTMKTVNTKRANGTKDCRWAIDTGTAYSEGFETPNDALKWAKRISGL